MATERLSMRQLREILRQKLVLGRTHREVAASLAIGSGSIDCRGCGASYPLRDGIALLAIRGTSETWGEPQAHEQSASYQGEYQRVDRAAAYNLSYRQHLLKRQSTQREFKLIQQHVARIGRSRIILDLPCGGGRLTPAFADTADLVIEADIAHGQLLFNRAESSGATPRVWMTASAFHIPLRDASVDGTFCIRLSHHLPTATERENAPPAATVDPASVVQPLSE